MKMTWLGFHSSCNEQHGESLCDTNAGLIEPGWQGENQRTVYTWRKLDLENGKGTV